MLKNEKSANRNDHQNRQTEVFCSKNRKTDLKNSQNRKTENPNAPLFINWGVKSSRLFSEGKSVHIIALSSVLDDFDELPQKSQQFFNKSFLVKNEPFNIPLAVNL